MEYSTPRRAAGTESVMLAMIAKMLTINIMLQHKLTDCLAIRPINYAVIILNGDRPIFKKVSMVGAQAKHVVFAIRPQVRLLSPTDMHGGGNA